MAPMMDDCISNKMQIDCVFNVKTCNSLLEQSTKSQS